MLFPGLVVPYPETHVSLEVVGRVIELLNVGDDVEGESTDRNGEVTAPGTIFARLDSAPYERAYKQVGGGLQSERVQPSAQQVQLEQVLTARLASTRSNAAAAERSVPFARDGVASNDPPVALAQTTLERNRKLLKMNAVAGIAVRESESALDTAKARMAQTPRAGGTGGTEVVPPRVAWPDGRVRTVRFPR